MIAFIVASRLSPYFLSGSYLLDKSTEYMETGLVAIGMTFVIIAGDIDLSVGGNVVLTGCLLAKLLSLGWSIPAGVSAACMIGALLGALNGLLVAKLRIPSFLVTLGTMAAYRGAAQALFGGAAVKLPHPFVGIDMKSLAGVPWPLIIFLSAALLGGIVLHQTVYGRWTFAVGTNESASRYSGIPIARVRIANFALLGLLCGIGAVLLDSRIGSAKFDLVNGIELDAITVVVLGGTAISGGSGGMLGTVLALFLIGVIKAGMGVADVKAEYQLTAIGALLILAVLFVNLSSVLGARLAARRGAGSF